MACPALGMRTGDKSFISGWVEDVQCTAQPGYQSLSSSAVAKTDFAACESESMYVCMYVCMYACMYVYVPA